MVRLIVNVYPCMVVYRLCENQGRRSREGLGAEPPTFASGGLISKIAPHFLCAKNILQGPFWSHKGNLSIKKLLEG